MCEYRGITHVKDQTFYILEADGSHILSGKMRINRGINIGNEGIFQGRK